MSNLKLIIKEKEDLQETLMLPSSTTELFISNNNNPESDNYILNIGSSLVLSETPISDFSFNNLKELWEILRVKDKKNIIAIEIYVDDNLTYSISNIQKINYVIEFLGTQTGERIGIQFQY